MTNLKNKPLFNLHDKKVILASSSPRRQEILSSMGVDFEIQSPEINEERKAGEEPRIYALRMAHEKAKVVADRNPNCVIIAADTSVFHGKRVLDKARTNDDVKLFMQTLSGKNHKVYSSVAVIFPNGKCIKKVSTTTVKMKRLTPYEIKMYIESGEGLGKAGGYAIQGIASTFIISMSGSYTGVVGLPIYELSQILKGYDGK